jgi:hypothetical protein
MADRDYYVETSVWGMIPKGQPRELRKATLQFLRRCPGASYCVSAVVLDEINACDEATRTAIMEVFETSAPRELKVTPEARELARFYVHSGILPARKTLDALHVAIATVHEMDVLVSWNHRHIANVRKSEQYQGANLMRGYWKTPLISTPLEVLHE